MKRLNIQDVDVAKSEVDMVPLKNEYWDMGQEYEYLLRIIKDAETELNHLKCEIPSSIKLTKILTKVELAALSMRKLFLLLLPDKKDEIIDQIEINLNIQITEIKDRGYEIELPMLLPKKKRSSNEYIHQSLYSSFKRYFTDRSSPHLSNIAIVFNHIYSHKSLMRDYDNFEIKATIDMINLFFLADDNPENCVLFHYASRGDRDHTRISLVPIERLHLYIEAVMKESFYQV